MNIRTAVKERRSIRKFKPDEVPQEVIREILEEARWAPSWGNTQPWEFYVLTGDTLAEFKKANIHKVMEGVSLEPEIPMPEEWPETLQKRYRGVGRSLLGALSVARDDTDARNRFYGEMYNLFNAPCMILICIDKSLSIEYAMLDVGLIMQTICLLAHERGLGSCIMAAAVMYPGILRELLPIPENRLIVIGAALGYPELESPINLFERERAALDEIVIWVS